MMRRAAMVAGALLLAVPAQGQGLFRDSVPLEVTIVTDLKAVIRDRDSTKFKPHEATLSYRDSAGATKTFPVTLRARGHFRRQSRNCDFPPLKLEFERKNAALTLFQGNSQLKITTNCRPGNAEYEQYVLGEYAIYRAYQAVSPKYFRTRLAKITYHDSAKKEADVVSWAFFVEDDKEVAKKFALAVDDSRGALFRDVDENQLAITALFQYMVANTDWSISGLHNVSLMRDSSGTLHTVAYDFDWSGAVNARYAAPDYRLNLRAVTDRLYRGPCRPMADWQPVFARFTAARPLIEGVYTGTPGLDPAYLAEFYQVLAEPKTLKNALTDKCMPHGN